jgi:hypothetical protein
VAVVALGGLLWTGYQRRKGIWTQWSWLLFAASLLGTFVLIGVALSMATGVDNGIYGKMHERYRAPYFYTMTALGVSGVLGTVLLILSFARGDQHRQFGFFTTFRRSGPGMLQQVDLRNRLHSALVAVGFVLVVERSNPESYGGWQRDYVRGGELIRLTWNNETWYFTLDGGKPLRTIASKSPGDLSATGLAEFIASTNEADLAS